MQAQKLERVEDVFDALDWTEEGAVYGGGSARRVAISPTGEEYDAWIDLDGLWISDPCDAGYLSSVRGWSLEYYR